MSDEFALFITWTCYGTWLPGDARGHVSNRLQSDGSYLPKLNTPGTPSAGFDADAIQAAKELQKWPTTRLASKEARWAADGLVDAVTKRNWRIHRGAVMYNHVHVVVSKCPNDGPAVRRILKGCSQAYLSDHAGRIAKWWTRGESNRYLNDEQAILGAMRYVEEQEGILWFIRDNQVTDGP